MLESIGSLKKKANIFSQNQHNWHSYSLFYLTTHEFQIACFFSISAGEYQKRESKDRMPDCWRKKLLIHFPLLLWPQSVGRRGVWRWKGQGNNFWKPVQWLEENSMKTDLKLLEVLFYPCDNLTQIIFHLLFRFCYESKEGKQANEEGWERLFYFTIFPRNLVVTKRNRSIPRLNLRLYASWRPNLQQISVLQGQNHPLSRRSCPRSWKKTDSNMKLIVLPLGVASTWGCGHWAASKWWSLAAGGKSKVPGFTHRVLLRGEGSCDIKTFIPSEQRPIYLSWLLTWCVFNAVLRDGWFGPPTIYLPKVNVNAPEVCRGNESPGCFWNLGDN